MELLSAHALQSLCGLQHSAVSGECVRGEALASANRVRNLAQLLFVNQVLNFSRDFRPVGALDDHHEARVEDDASDREAQPKAVDSHVLAES